MTLSSLFFRQKSQEPPKSGDTPQTRTPTEEIRVPETLRDQMGVFHALTSYVLARVRKDQEQRADIKVSGVASEGRYIADHSIGWGVLGQTLARCLERGEFPEVRIPGIAPLKLDGAQRELQLINPTHPDSLQIPGLGSARDLFGLSDEVATTVASIRADGREDASFAFSEVVLQSDPMVRLTIGTVGERKWIERAAIFPRVVKASSAEMYPPFVLERDKQSAEVICQYTLSQPRTMDNDDLSFIVDKTSKRTARFSYSVANFHDVCGLRLGLSDTLTFIDLVRHLLKDRLGLNVNDSRFLDRLSYLKPKGV